MYMSNLLSFTAFIVGIAIGFLVGMEIIHYHAIFIAGGVLFLAMLLVTFSEIEVNYRKW